MSLSVVYPALFRNILVWNHFLSLPHACIHLTHSFCLVSTRTFDSHVLLHARAFRRNRNPSGAFPPHRGPTARRRIMATKNLRVSIISNNGLKMNRSSSWSTCSLACVITSTATSISISNPCCNETSSPRFQVTLTRIISTDIPLLPGSWFRTCQSVSHLNHVHCIQYVCMFGNVLQWKSTCMLVVSRFRSGQ